MCGRRVWWRCSDAPGGLLPLGSAVTGLMVWRDLDFGVDAPALTRDGAWETMRPLLRRCSALHYAHDLEDQRHSHYPEVVGGWEIYDAVLNHGVRTRGARRFPRRARPADEARAREPVRAPARRRLNIERRRSSARSCGELRQHLLHAVDLDLLVGVNVPRERVDLRLDAASGRA